MDTSDESLANALCRLLGVRNVKLERLTMGKSLSRTYLVDTSVEIVVVKTS